MNATYDEIVNRMKQGINVSKDVDLAKELEISPQAISKFKKQGRIPAELVVNFGLDFGLSLDWIYRGFGEMFWTKEEGSTLKIDDGLLEAAIEMSEELLESLGKHVTPKQRTQLILALYEVANEKGDHKIDRPTALRLVKLMAA
jgi:hypothetical protein